MKHTITLLLIMCCAYSSHAQQDTFTVYFANGISELSPAGKKYFDSLFYAEQIQGAKTLAIYGYADEPGTNELNHNLSVKRAEAVKDYLLLSGIPVSVIVLCEGKGNIGDAADPHNRKVDVVKVKTVLKPAADITVLAKLKKNEAIELKNVLFRASSHDMLPSSVGELNSLLAILKARPGMEIRIEGHICCMYKRVGDGMDMETKTYTLSYQRTLTIYNYLVAHGIDKKRLSCLGLGATKPLHWPEKSDQDQKENRRVEIRVMHI